MVTDVEQPMTEAGLMAQRPPLSAVLGAWQPMKTAPTDGTAVLALLDRSDIPYAMRWLLADDPRGSGKDGWHIIWDGSRLSDRFPVRYWMRCPPDPDASNAMTPNAKVSERSAAGAESARLLG